MHKLIMSVHYSQSPLGFEVKIRHTLINVDTSHVTLAKFKEV